VAQEPPPPKPVEKPVEKKPEPPKPVAESKPKDEPKPIEKKPDPPKVDPIAEALKHDDAKKPVPKAEAKAAAPQPPQKPKERVFDATKMAALIDKRDPTRQAATGTLLNSSASLGSSRGTAATLSQSELDAMRARLASLGLVATAGFLLTVSLVVSAALAAVSDYLKAVFPEAEVALQLADVAICDPRVATPTQSLDEAVRDADVVIVADHEELPGTSLATLANVARFHQALALSHTAVRYGLPSAAAQDLHSPGHVAGVAVTPGSLARDTDIAVLRDWVDGVRG